MSGDIHALSGAYAVDAIDDIERAQFERHLNSCADCRLEVATLREGAALLAESVAQPAPAALRGEVLATIATVRPLPPLLADVRARARRRRLPVLLASAAALVVIGGAGATVWHPWDQPVTEITASQQLENAPDVEVLTEELGGGASITVTRSKSLNAAYVSTLNMPRLSSEQTYQLWTIHDGRSTPAGLVDGDASKVVVDGNPGTASALAVTIEPAGGVEQPTSKYIVASFDFTQA